MGGEGKGVSSVAVSTWVLWSSTHSPILTHNSFTPASLLSTCETFYGLRPADANSIVSNLDPIACAFVVAPGEWLIGVRKQNKQQSCISRRGGWLILSSSLYI